ncbi:MAG TPA: NAD(P) transhydrogenase subunit alpha [Trebonia sp.]|jgi:NAD(P) transhydrogenase subunit alpha|nr:NAD(P) transhydrogenase subunit alpha [Trebonia sp.]
MKVAVVKESAPGERRVALVPEAVGRLRQAGIEVLVEAGAGDGAWFPDSAYEDAGARVVSPDDLYATADVVLTVTRPDPDRLRRGQAVIGLLSPLINPGEAAALAERGVTAVSLDGLPRTLSRAQGMDALTSQANVAGYKAALVAAEAYGRFFPMLITAAGTARPARLLVLGAGVAGLQAIGTARRLGAQVSGYDVRPASKGEVESLGATFLQLTSVTNAAGEGGYARELNEQERAAQQAELEGHISRHDIIITTAQVPGRKPPLLVTDDAVKAMAPGSVIVDMGASPLGGNVAGSRPGESIVTGNGVTIIGAQNLASTVPTAASNAYSRNISALLLAMTSGAGEGGPALAIDTADEIQAGVVVAHGGQVVHPAVARLLGGARPAGAQAAASQPAPPVPPAPSAEPVGAE